MRVEPGGRPARPAGRQQGGRLHPRQRRGRAGGHPPGTRAGLCRPSPPAGPGRLPGSAPQGHLARRLVPPAGVVLVRRRPAGSRRASPIAGEFAGGRPTGIGPLRRVHAFVCASERPADKSLPDQVVAGYDRRGCYLVQEGYLACF
jgi:hypothetical protein